MRFEWDEEKRLENLRKHGLDFRDAHLVLDSVVLTERDERFAYDETRYYSIGLLNGITVVLSHTEDSMSFRVISFRRAEKYEETRYYNAIRNGLGES